MNNESRASKGNGEEKTPKPGQLVSAELDDGTLVEMLHDRVAKTTAFCVGDAEGSIISTHVELDGRRFFPLPPASNLLKHDVVLFPSHPEPYDSEACLLEALRRYIHKWVDLSPLFEQIAAHYILLSWVYDAFRELPYLRVRGDYGTGKTRFLLVVGSVCRKPIFVSGASTVSPIFRLLDSIQGTLVLDEGDFRQSDERAEIIKILNNGNARGFPVLRSDATPAGFYEPRAYAVFGPKVVASRGSYADRALESRFLTEELGGRTLRNDIPLNLDEEYQEEALFLRNQLLTFRLRNKAKLAVLPTVHEPGLEPRLNQIFAPLLSVIDDPALVAEVRNLAREYQRFARNERGQELPGQVTAVIRELKQHGERLTVKAIAEQFFFRFGTEWQFPPSTKKIGHVLRERLNLRTERGAEGYALAEGQEERLEYIFDRYGLNDLNEPRPKEDAPPNLPI